MLERPPDRQPRTHRTSRPRRRGGLPSTSLLHGWSQEGPEIPCPGAFRKAQGDSWAFTLPRRMRSHGSEGDVPRGAHLPAFQLSRPAPLSVKRFLCVPFLIEIREMTMWRVQRPPERLNFPVPPVASQVQFSEPFGFGRMPVPLQAPMSTSPRGSTMTMLLWITMDLGSGRWIQPATCAVIRPKGVACPFQSSRNSPVWAFTELVPAPLYLNLRSADVP